MLVRSAARRQQRHTSQVLAASFAQLNLPWLAPAQLRWNASNAIGTTQTPSRPPRHRHLRQRQAPNRTRQLATAADSFAPSGDTRYTSPVSFDRSFKNDTRDDYIPWDFSKSSSPSQLSQLRPTENPILINTSIQGPSPWIKVQNGVQGTTLDLLQHLHTSLRVGRLERAQAIIQRLARQCSPSSPELLYAHTAYLEESLNELVSHSTKPLELRSKTQAMQKWFEMEIQKKGIQPDAQIYILMVRAAIRGLEGKQRDRTIRRYADNASRAGEEMYDEVLFSDDYDDHEFAVLGEATSEHLDTSDANAFDVQETAGALKEQEHTHFQRRDTLAVDDLPDVLSTEQKGEGLEGVKKTMNAFAELPALSPDAPVEAQRARALERQRLIEQTSVDVAVDRWRKADEELRRIGINTAMQTRPIGALMWQWYTTLLKALEQELDEVSKMLESPGKDHERLHYGPYLEVLPLEKVAANTILYTMSRLTKGKDMHSDRYEHEVKLSGLTVGLGKAIEQESLLELSLQRRRKNGKVLRARKLQRALAEGKKANHQFEPAAFTESSEQPSAFANLSWPSHVKVKLGAMLISKLIETAQLPVTRDHPRTKQKITQLQPAFMHRVRYQRGKRIGMLTPNPTLVHKIESEPIGSLIAKRMPMVVEPKPWTGWNEGGYYHYPNSIIRLATGDKSGKDYFKAAHKMGDTEQVYASLNALGKVPWKINHDVFKAQLEAWNSGEAIANFAPLHPHFELPPEPEPSTDPNPRRKWLTEVRDLENKKAGLHSQRCFQNFQLEIARSLLNETLYFPHNLDFRGRAYPIPPYLNHMGADNARALLMFGEGKELGTAGLRWLKIHLANVAGYDKASLQEREDYTMSHLDEIYDSVHQPFTGRRWWLKSDDAWQTLAACCELTRALDSPDPTKFVSHLPIHQDGTCNGLQHYAALGGDKAGAAQVNLEPGDRPSDIYAGVAKAVIEEVDADAAKGNPIANALVGHITRKVVKQPVMTNVYGVTFYGAKAQVQRQIEEMFPDMRKFDLVNHSNISLYIATKIFKCLGSMFTGAQAIQHWLGQCADRISTCLTPEQIKQLTSPKYENAGVGKTKRGPKAKSSQQTSASINATEKGAVKPMFKSTVVWTTPLRLPVVQPYRSTKARAVTTNLQMISLQEPQVWDPVSRRKQLQGFPPNFIHSLDATHMMLSALKCNEVGLTFASIHDSFWTHACDVSRMSEVLRNAFVAMHSDDIIGRLREEFLTRYRGCMYMASVNARSAVGLKITKLRKEMKQQLAGAHAELALETERVRLLSSDDADDRAKGEAMVTPGSIFDAEGDESLFALPSEIAEQGLGKIPDLAEVEPTKSEVEDALLPDKTAEEGMVSNSVLATDTDALAESTSSVRAGNHSEEPLKPLDRGTQQRKAKTAVRKLSVWLPLRFPEVPEKGGFDVTRLMESKYFFH